jgi:hypothetical protein
LWFALENGAVLQPPVDNKGIETIEFPVKSLDYLSNIADASDNSSNYKVELLEDFEFSKASYISITSMDVLNINVTPSAYKVIMYLLNNIFAAQVNKEEFFELSEKPKLKFLNFMGEPCHLTMPHESPLQDQHAIGFSLSNYSSTKVQVPATPTRLLVSQLDTSNSKNYKFQLLVDGFERNKLSMKYDGCYLFQLKESKDGTAARGYNVMYQVKSLYGRTKVIFSSPLKVENNCQIKVNIYIEINDQISQQEMDKLIILSEFKAKERTFGLLFRLLPGKIYHVPIYLAYKCKLYVTPDNELYAPSLVFDIRGYNFKTDDPTDVIMDRLVDHAIELPPSSSSSSSDTQLLNESDFQFVRLLRINVKSHKMSIPSMHANYTVALYPTLKISNCLPIQIRIDVDPANSILVNEGENLNVHFSRDRLKSCKICIVNYLGADWVAQIDWDRIGAAADGDNQLKSEKIEMTIVPNTEMTIQDKHLSVHVAYTKPNEFLFYCPYWLVNKSGQPIKIRSNLTDRTFVIPDDTILLFDYKKVNKNNKVMMNVNNGKWSKSFSLEAAGTTGMINCKDLSQKKTFNFLMRITMSNSSRTKLVTFAPFLSIVNQLEERIRIREWHLNDHRTGSDNDWISIEPITPQTKPEAIWTNAGIGKEVFFVLRLENDSDSDSDPETKPFPLENPGRFVLALGDKKILTILISGGSSNPVTIVVRKYQYGDSVAKVTFLNLLFHTLSIIHTYTKV